MKKQSVVTDVTSYISAQEYILSKPMGYTANDPFALQSFAELMQTLFLYENVYVSHPVILRNCSDEHFGQEPEFLKALLERDIVKPLNLSRATEVQVVQNEDSLLQWLQDNGAELLNKHLTFALEDDQTRQQTGKFFVGKTLPRLSKWCQYHYDKIRYNDEHHKARISTQDGIEDDLLGDFARSFAFVFRKRFETYLRLESNPTDYLIATILRGLRYQIRANLSEMIYHPHVIRRDFVLMCGFDSLGISEDYTREVIKLIRGVQESVSNPTEPQIETRVELLRFTVPLLGGKLWKETDVGKYGASWIDFVADRVVAYREKTQLLRQAIRDLKDEEDIKRLKRDFEDIGKQLLESFGLESTPLTETDNELIESGLAIAGDVTGFPNTKNLLVNVTKLAKRKIHKYGGSPLQQFVIREFLHGWKETK